MTSGEASSANGMNSEVIDGSSSVSRVSILLYCVAQNFEASG